MQITQPTIISNSRIEGSLVIEGEPVPAYGFAGRLWQAWRIMRRKPITAQKPVSVAGCIFGQS